MANVITGNPLKLDTVGVVSPFETCRVSVDSIAFVGYSAATDVARLKDAEGRIIWEGQGHDDFSPVETHELGWVKGLNVDTLSGGTGFLLLYLRP